MHANPQTNTIYPIRQSPRNLTYFEVRQMSPTYSQPLTQYAVSNKQQQIQSPQTSQRSSVMISHTFRFENVIFFPFSLFKNIDNYFNLHLREVSEH